MNCPFCKVEGTKVIDSRVVRDTPSVRRRRSCEKCERRFTTFERVEDLFPSVVKRDGRRETFDREKVRRGLHLAFKKRDVSESIIDGLVDHVERHVADLSEREVTSGAIGETVMESIRHIDEVAYVRFVSVYRQFGDVKEFVSELASLVDRREERKGGT
ncbi:MAG: transcriptional repressor NrdR [Myxococcales bacterium]|nr:transcriptional repressor NrdR [Myxococcales bacterium]